MENLSFVLKYPFSSEARTALEGSKLSITSRIIERGLDRIKAALKGPVPKSSANNPSEIMEELAGYAAARMILSSMRNNFLTNKFAVAEGKRAYAYLNYETEDNIKKILKEFDFRIKKTEEGENSDYFLIHFSTYLKYSPGSLDYRLINKNLSNGYVQVSNHERLRLLQEAIKMKIQALPLLKKAPEEIKKAADSLLSELPKTTYAKTSFKEGENPPCVEALLASVRKHQNLNHQSRWFLAVYLLNKGMNVESILELFSNLPDYSEKISRYQVEHAKKQGYTTPACATVRSYGLCVANCRIGSPLNWRGKGTTKEIVKKESKGEENE